MDQTILANLVLNEPFARQVLPFLAPEYFGGVTKDLFEMVAGHFAKYNAMPTKEALRVLADEPSNLNEEKHKQLIKAIDELKIEENTHLDFLIDKTEKFCQDRAIENALRHSILILDGKEKTLDKGSIPKLLQDALSVTFNSHIGLDVLEDGEMIWEKYRAVEDKIAFDLDWLNDITKGGVSRKSLIIFLAGTGVGKTLVMCHLAAAGVQLGRNVLYITLEMAEEKISERIHANMMDMTIDSMKLLELEPFLARLERVKKRSPGRLIVKEYPTASAGTNHFRYLLNELKLKQKFMPDVVFVDYLNLCASARIKMGATVNSYTYIKAVAEELRGLAVENNFALISATQTTRSGYESSDLELGDTSESFGLPATADFMAGIISEEDMEEQGLIMFKQLKNRWGDINYKKRYAIGIDRPKMKLFDAEESAQDNIMKESSGARKPGREAGGPPPVMDDSPLGFREKNKRNRNFEGFDDE